MNQEYKKESLKEFQLPKRIDSFNDGSFCTTDSDEGFTIKYDGWHFEAKTQKAVINKVLKYIFVGGEE